MNGVEIARRSPSLPWVGIKLFAGENTRKVAETLAAHPGHGPWRGKDLAEAAGVVPSAVTNAKGLLGREAYIDEHFNLIDLDGLRALESEPPQPG